MGDPCVCRCGSTGGLKPLPTPDLQGLGGLGSGPSEDLKSEGRLQACTSKRVQSTDIVECRVSILGSAAMI